MGDAAKRGRGRRVVCGVIGVVGEGEERCDEEDKDRFANEGNRSLSSPSVWTGAKP